MPNHIHGIVTIIDRDVEGAQRNAPRQGALLRAPTSGAVTRAPRTIGALVGAFKGAVTRRIDTLQETSGASIWQRNYFEHIIRDEDEFVRILAYIEENPRRWEEDEYHPNRGA